MNNFFKFKCKYNNFSENTKHTWIKEDPNKLQDQLKDNIKKLTFSILVYLDFQILKGEYLCENIIYFLLTMFCTSNHMHFSISKARQY